MAFLQIESGNSPLSNSSKQIFIEDIIQSVFEAFSVFSKKEYIFSCITIQIKFLKDSRNQIISSSWSKIVENLLPIPRFMVITPWALQLSRFPPIEGVKPASKLFDYYLE